MKKSHLWAIVCTFAFSLISIPSHAELIDSGGGLTASLLLGASAALADTFTLEKLKTDDLSFVSGGMLFSNCDVGARSVNAENIGGITKQSERGGRTS
jgi:hypothetical protein